MNWSDAVEAGLAALGEPSPADSPAPFPVWFGGCVATGDPAALILLALRAPCLGYAFAAGYQHAIRQLVGCPLDDLHALCVTEQGSTRPGDMRVALDTQVEGLRLRGRKDYVTLGQDARTLLVLARRGEHADGRADLALVRVNTSQPGVTISPLPALPFIPEIGHAAVTFENVVISPEAVFAGDGYENWVRRFRWLEDGYVTLATLATTLGLVWRCDRRVGWVETLAGLLAQQVGLLEGPGSVASIAYHDLEQRWSGLREQLKLAWRAVDCAERQAWIRDERLAALAAKARAVRVERAWDKLGRVHP